MLKLTEYFLHSVRSMLSLLSNAAVLGSKEPCQVPAFSKGILNGKQKILLLKISIEFYFHIKKHKVNNKFSNRGNDEN